ncbi:MAG: toxic anion resistance protein [Ruminiclostridium sp.]|nr:toxic anion resistance protein [Ruminiclostridium sp.]
MFETNTPITLELGLTETEPAAPPAPPAPEEVEAAYLREIPLSDAERKMVDDFAEKIDLNNSALILQYGAAAQKKVADFSDSALEGVRTKDLGQTGDMITNLVTELKDFSAEPEEQGGFLGFFKKASSKIERMKTRYAQVEVSIDGIVSELEGHQNQLLADIVMLDKLYEANLTYFKELTMYIMAGKKRLEQDRVTTLVQLQQTAAMSGQMQDAQAANDFANQCSRFEKKIHDLELTRTISIQMAPQIRLIQNNNAMMSEKIQSTIHNTIPLWKNQMVLALGMAHSQQAMEAQRAVTDLTNELLRKNADALRIGTVEVARESERGIVDMETLAYTNEQLISTLDEVLQVQTEGRQKRQAAEAELVRIEGQLKQKLLEVRSQ